MISKLNAADAVKRMKKAHGLHQPSPPMSLEDGRQVMKQGGRKQVNRAVVPPRGAFSAQMLRPPSTPTFSTDSPLEHSLRPEDDEDFSSGGYDYGFVTSRRGSNQAMSPPPPPPPAPSRHPRSSIRRPMMAGTAAVSTPKSPAVQGGQDSSRNMGILKSKQTSPGVHSNNHEQPGNQSTDKPTPSVHPIDTLSKKLRQQAMELTHVYEELEKQNLQIDEYKQQVRDQKRQLEQLQAQRRKSIDGSSKTPTNSRALALEQQKRATQMMIGTPSTGASLGQKRGELERKIKEADREKKKYELAAKRIEKALVELQVFQNDRMEKLFPADGVANQRENDADTPDDLEAVFNEQRAYIRVLEEAVHLKATDFEVTGHEELLIVLAELRHTIYEQEKDVEQKNSTLSTIQEQLEQERRHHLETKELLAAVQKQQEEMVQHFQEQESALYAQINETQGELKQKDNHLNQLEGASSDAQRAEEALQNRLAAVMKAQNLTEAKLEDAARTINALQEQLTSRTTKFEEGQRQIVKLQEECAKKQAHLDELNALQEELLTSVDKYVNKVKKSRDKVERLEAELQSCKEKKVMAKAQADDASRSSSEELAALRTKISEAEQREQQVQTQFTALQQEKTRLEFTLAEVQQSLQSQIQESSDQQQEISAKQKKYNQVEEAVAELESALSAALRMMLGRSSETLASSEAEGAVKMDESRTDSTDHSFLLDQAVFRDLRVCCQALDTLTTSNGPPQCTSLCPSFEMVNRIAAIGEQVQTEMSRALSSWSREHTNLVEACAVLDSTALMCQDEMEKRHQEICDCRQELAERTMEVEAYAMQVDTLDEQLRRAEAECEAFHALEQHAADQERVLEAKETLIRDLTAENDRLEKVESAYSVQVSTNTRLTQQLEDQRAAMNAQRTYSEELEHALESAATFAEQQNERNQQLNTQLAQVEKSNREQADHLKTIEVQTSAFSSRFLGLVKQYAAFLRPTAATDRSLQDHLNQFDVEIQNGDVLRLLQLFPALLEEYISTCSKGSDHSPLNKGRTTSLSISNNKKLRRPVKWPAEKPHRINMDTSTPVNSKSSPPSSPLRLVIPASRTPRCSNRAEKEAQLAEQLELIRGAFQSYRDDVVMDR
ncbi:hypothetical protein PF005_g20044 [Phytophthora fragariae]|uniref:Uncharacterized protein n=1 Tax=Phytophthora fragariae TaxID=53985 RepID=A0A6A3RA96_9STRA|nr:hypothetical protein PF003_g6921 [Phytophthora fragariae]KAE8928433.1 hypothetical protein PF009_g21422 [Phytophthora fragariae]KAE9091841.1 hypothetical protein PF007_g18733 [Phytophthora fragariae]KAE9116930.1 hypothetical protein PF006_g18929 [Phytophthora fragariae]KAE9188463.1 hypothetical protein PF005_g20044 [Phytophthora fragariae]